MKQKRYVADPTARIMAAGNANQLADIAQQETVKTRFEGKTILVTGDSITEGTGTTTKAWHEYLADWLGCTVLNDGKSSTGLIRNNGGVPGIYTRIDTWKATYGDVDAIIVMGNMNDGGLGAHSFPVGSFTDAVATASQYGALHKTMQKLIARYPNTPIGWVISTPRKENTLYPSPNNGKAWGTDGWFEPYAQAILAVCNHYSIPVLDLYHHSQLRPWDTFFNLKYFNAMDGVHPNALGHEIMAKKIIDWVIGYVAPIDSAPQNPVDTTRTFELGTVAPDAGNTALIFPAITARARDTQFLICSHGAVFTVVDPLLYNIAVYFCTADTNAYGTYLMNAPTWAAYQVVTDPLTTHVRIALKKMSGVDFTTDELNAINSIFTYTPG